MLLESEVAVDWLEGAKLHGAEVSLQELVPILEQSGKELGCFSVSELINAFQCISVSLLQRSNQLYKIYPNSGIPYLGKWCTADNLSDMLIDSFGSLDCLDRFVVSGKNVDREVKAFPKGFVVHWMAGNVPTLGLLSLISGILTKNVNLVRLPSLADNLLVDLMAHFCDLGEVCKAIAKSVGIIRYDFNNQEAAESLSLLADVRMIWGGDESSQAIKKLPTKLTSLDMVFPDRTSFAVVGKSMLSEDKLKGVTRLIAHDASVFEQKACASPHTVFLMSDNDFEIKRFCQFLADAMQATLKEMPKRVPSQKEIMSILNLRTQYDMFYDAWYSKGAEFTILSDNKIQLGPPIGNRTIYVRKLISIEELLPVLPENIQTIGIAADQREFEIVTSGLGSIGIHRFTPLGAMTQFEVPWDGIRLPHYLVRWTSRPVLKGSAEL